jgi:hypothetical protein
VVYPGDLQGRPVELVFAVYLRQHRPAIQAALVDAATGNVLPWQQGSVRPASESDRVRRPVRSPAPVFSAPTDPGPGMPAGPASARAERQIRRSAIF